LRGGARSRLTSNISIGCEHRIYGYHVKSIGTGTGTGSSTGTGTGSSTGTSTGSSTDTGTGTGTLLSS
jgi:hypothetical protein